MTNSERKREGASVSLSPPLPCAQFWRRAEAFAKGNVVCLHTVWEPAKTNSSHRQQTVTLPLLVRTQLMLHQRGRKDLTEEGEEKQKERKQKRQKRRRSVVVRWTHGKHFLESLPCVHSYLSLLNLREWRMAGLFCLRFHRWTLSSARALTSAPCRKRWAVEFQFKG